MEELISISPSMLFISNSDWSIQDKQDCFLKNIIEILREVDEYKTHKILWTDKLEEILWTSPQYNPWLHMYDTKNSLITILYKYLSSNTLFIDCNHPLNNIEPKLEISIKKEIITDEYSKIFNELIESEREFSIYHKCICFTYTKFDLLSSNKQSYSPNIFFNIKEYLNSIKYTSIFWPITIEHTDKIYIAIEICRKIHFNDKNFLYKYSFSNIFIKRISELHRDYRKNLIQKLTKRLCLTNQEAASDIQLQDEFLISKNENRIRITPRPTSTRVHYNFQENNIKFTAYYGEGEHDDGL